MRDDAVFEARVWMDGRGETRPVCEALSQCEINKDATCCRRTNSPRPEEGVMAREKNHASRCKSPASDQTMKSLHLWNGLRGKGRG